MAAEAAAWDLAPAAAPVARGPAAAALQVGVAAQAVREASGRLGSQAPRRALGRVQGGPAVEAETARAPVVAESAEVVGRAADLAVAALELVAAVHRAVDRAV